MLFFLFILTVFAMTYGYVGLRLIIPARVSRKWKIILMIIVVFFFFMPLDAFIMLRFNFHPLWIKPYIWVAYISLGFFSLLFILLLSFDILTLTIRIINKIVNGSKLKKSIKKEHLPMEGLSRKKFLINTVNAGIMGLTTALTGYGIYEAQRSSDIVKVKIPISNLPPEFRGFRIAQISDLHASTTISYNFIRDVVDKVNQLKPDLIVITGDLADGSVEQLAKDVEPLSRLTSTHGTCFVTGNHEYYSGVNQWLKKTEELGIQTLLNEHKILKIKNQSIILAGVTDYNADRIMKSHRSSPKASVSGVATDTTKILLAHQPRSIFEASDAGFDLQISGHTHGGQYMPWNLFVRLQQPFVKGLHKHKDTWIYINRGTGYWGPPLRIGIPSEITEITLTDS